VKKKKKKDKGNSLKGFCLRIWGVDFFAEVQIREAKQKQKRKKQTQQKRETKEERNILERERERESAKING